MKVKYHPETDTASIDLVEGVPDVEGEEVADGVIVHFDENERPVRVEIYDRAKDKLAGLLSAGAYAIGESDDMLALTVGRAWLAGYRAGRADEEVDPGFGVWRHGA